MKILGENKKSRFDYSLQEKYEAGITLLGWEVKSALAKKINISASYVIIRSGEAFLINCEIAPQANHLTSGEGTSDSFKIMAADASRTRKLLLHKKEILSLMGQVEQKGKSLIVTKIYVKQNKIKVEFAVAVGKKLHDKRQSIKDRQVQRQTQAIVKNKIKS